MQRSDPLKVFVGSLQPQLIKPRLQPLWDRLGLSPCEVIVPACRGGKLAVAFVCFNTSSEALHAVQALSGLVDVEFSPSKIIALGLDNGSLYQLIWQIFWTLGSY
jgi:hypothetical protein